MISFLYVFLCIFSFVFNLFVGISGKTRLRNGLLCAEQDVKFYSLTHLGAETTCCGFSWNLSLLCSIFHLPVLLRSSVSSKISSVKD